MKKTTKMQFTPEAIKKKESQKTTALAKQVIEVRKQYVKNTVAEFKKRVKSGSIGSDGGEFELNFGYAKSYLPEIMASFHELGWDASHYIYRDSYYSITCGAESISEKDMLRLSPLKT